MGLYKDIGYGNGSYNHDIYKKREDNYLLVEAKKFIVFFEATADEIDLNNFKEILIQQTKIGRAHV